MQKPGAGSYNLVFDVGGVLVDWNPRNLYRAFFGDDSRSMEEFLAAIEFPRWNEALDCGRPFQDTVAEWSARFPRYARLIQAFDTRWEETIGGPIQGSVAIVRALDVAGIPLYGLTNSSPEKFKLLAGKYTFLEHFRWIMISGEFGVTKPDPRIFHLFLERTGLRSGDCILVDDSEINISSALRLGWQGIRFRSPEGLALELERRGLPAGDAAGLAPASGS